MEFASNRDIAVKVENLDASRKFYEDTLGLKLIKSEPKLLVYDAGYFTLYLSEGRPHPPIPSFTVENLQEAKQHLVANGCLIVEEMKRSLYFSDFDGNLWDIIEL